MTDSRAPILNLSPCFPGTDKILVRVVAIVPGWVETVCGICHNDQKKIGAWSAVFLPVPGKIMSIAADILPDPTNHYRGRG